MKLVHVDLKLKIRPGCIPDNKKRDKKYRFVVQKSEVFRRKKEACSGYSGLA